MAECVCLPPYIAYSIINYLRRRVPSIMDVVETYVWLVKGVTFTRLLMYDVGEAIRCAFETLNEEDAAHFVSLLVYQITSGRYPVVEKVREYAKEGKYDLINEMLCIVQNQFIRA